MRSTHTPALASQSLSIIIALIPYIREFIRRHMNPKQAVMLIEFDKLKRDYQEHQNEIHAKLVAIMADRLAVHCGELREIDWEATPTRDGPRQYVLMLTKETQTLHKVLSKYLSQATVEGVMSQVLAASVHRLSEEYGKVEFKSEEAKKRMAMDAAYINAKLGPLSEAGTAVASLETLVKDKATPRKVTMRGLLRRNGSSNNDSATGAGAPADEGTEADEDDDEDGDILTEAVPSGDHESKEEDANGGAPGRASEEKQVELTQSAEGKEDKVEKDEAPKTPEKSKVPLPEGEKYSEWSTRSPALSPGRSPERVQRVLSPEPKSSQPPLESPEPPPKSPEPALKSPTPPEKDLPAVVSDPLSSAAPAPPSPTKPAPPSPTKASPPVPAEEPRPMPPNKPKPRMSLEARLKAKLAAQAASAKPDKPRASTESAERVSVDSVPERVSVDVAKPADADKPASVDPPADKPAEDAAKDAPAPAPEVAKDATTPTTPPTTSPTDVTKDVHPTAASSPTATPPPPPKDDTAVVPSIPEAKDTPE